MAAAPKIIIIGLGAFGREIARTLKRHNAEVILMDKSSSVVNQMKQEGFKYVVQIDTTDAPTLSKFINPSDIVVLAMGESFEANILTVAVLNELGIRKIYTRATNEIQMRILDRMQITETLFPEKQEGTRFAMKLLYKDFAFIEEYAPDVFISEFPIPKSFYGKTIVDLKFRNKYHINVIGIKEKNVRKGESNEKMYPIGFENIVLNERHKMVLVGTQEDLKQLLYDTENETVE